MKIARQMLIKHTMSQLCLSEWGHSLYDSNYVILRRVTLSAFGHFTSETLKLPKALSRQAENGLS